jgi:hypothetical protein
VERGVVDGNGERRRSKRRSSLGHSLIFASLSVALIALAIVYDQRQDDGSSPAPRPTSPPGSQEYIDVVEALRGEDLKVESAPRGVRSPVLSVPGQAALVADTPLYVFVYDSPAERAAESDDALANPQGVLPATTPSGTPIVTGEVHVAVGSNVVVALVGGSAETIEKVDRAIAGLA